MATHSSVLSWRITGMGEPVGLPSMGSHRVRHDWSDLAAEAGFPLLHYLPEFAQSHVNWVRDTINHLILCCPFSSHSQLFPVSGLFQWIRSSHRVAKVLELQLQDFQWILKSLFPLGLTCLISLQSKGLSRIFSNIAVQKHQFFDTQPSLQSNSHTLTWLEKP